MSCGAGGTGAQGDTGGPASGSPSDGRQGRSLTPITSLTSQPSLLFAPPPMWLTSVFQAIQRDYINAFGTDAGASCIPRLSWLQQLVVKGKDVATAKADVTVYDSITLSIKSLCNNISLGLDIFGRSQNYVSLVASETINTLIDTQLNDLDQIQGVRDALAKADKNQLANLQNLSSAANALTKFIAQSKAQIETDAKRVNDLEDEISAALVDLGKIWGELIVADQSFQQAVSRQASCDYSSVLRCAALVATIVTTGGAGAALVAGIGGAIKGLQDINSAAEKDPSFSFKNMTSQFNQISKLATPVTNDVDSFKQSFQKIKPTLDAMQDSARPNPAAPGIPSDYAKLLASKADFDKQIEKYQNLPEAKKYSDLMNRFVAVAETRNNKIIEHDATVAAILGLYAAIAAKKAAIEQLASVNENNFDSSLDQNVQFLDSQLEAITINLVRQLIDMSKSIQYATLTKPNVEIGDYSPVALRAASAQMNSTYHAAMAQFGQPPAPANHIRISLASILTGASLHDFLEGKPVTIAIPSNSASDPFKQWYGVQTVGISIEDKMGKPLPFALDFLFEHQGRSLVYDQLGSPLVFSHTASVRGMYSQDAESVVSSAGVVFDDANRWLGVSPYGPWRVKLAADAVHRENIAQALLSFSIRGRIRHF
jgi:hypothetical protein